MKHDATASWIKSSTYASLMVRVGTIIRVLEVQGAFTISNFRTDPYYRMTIAQKLNFGDAGYHYQNIDTIELHNEIPLIQIEPKRQDGLCIIINIDTNQDSDHASFDYSFELGPAKWPSPPLRSFQQYPKCVHYAYDMNDDQMILPPVEPQLGDSIHCTVMLRAKPEIVNAAKIIQRKWRDIYYDPHGKIGHRQLKSSLKTMLGHSEQSQSQSNRSALVDQVVGFTRINDNRWEYDGYTDQHVVNLVLSHQYRSCQRFYLAVITLKSNRTMDYINGH